MYNRPCTLSMQAGESLTGILTVASMWWLQDEMVNCLSGCPLQLLVSTIVSYHDSSLSVTKVTTLWLKLVVNACTLGLHSDISIGSTYIYRSLVVTNIVCQ